MSPGLVMELHRYLHLWRLPVHHDLYRLARFRDDESEISTGDSVNER
jgi:hypothetical protein